MMEIKAKLTITQSHGLSGSRIDIEVMDEASRSRFLELRVGLAEFAAALTGLAHVECEGTFREDAPVGKALEVKTVGIPYAGWGLEAREQVEAMMHVLEVDGWQGDVRSLNNWNNWRNGMASVTLRRWV